MVQCCVGRVMSAGLPCATECFEARDLGQGSHAMLNYPILRTATMLTTASNDFPS